MALMLAGCGIDRRLSDKVPPVPAALAEVPEPPAPTGAIWHASLGGLAPAEDRRARRVGDLLTIRLVERIQAEKSVDQTASRNSQRSVDLPDAAPFNRIDEGLFSGGTQSSFSGSGSTSQANRLSGEFTVTVVRLLPNGAMMVAGDRRIRLVRGEEQVQLTGIVRPEDIRSDNTVDVSQIAEARITYGGRGQLMDVQQPRWGQQVIEVLSPF